MTADHRSGLRGPASTVQEFGDAPTEVRESTHYKHEYVQTFVDKWDELIDWRARYESEGKFFVQQLRDRGVKSVLDVATGTGFHSVRLLEEGFETVVSADGSAEMLRLAREREAGGSGLGLAIAREVARENGGDVELGDAPLGGARAVLRLPR